MSMVTKESIRVKIEDWEHRADEAFLDYWDNMGGGLAFMSWCLAQGFITSEKFILWDRTYKEDPLLAGDTLQYVHSDYPWAAIVTPEEASEKERNENTEKSLMLVSAFIASFPEQQEHLEAFLAESVDEEDD